MDIWYCHLVHLNGHNMKVMKKLEDADCRAQAKGQDSGQDVQNTPDSNPQRPTESSANIATESGASNIISTDAIATTVGCLQALQGNIPTMKILLKLKPI